MLPDFLPAAEVLAKGVKHVACYVADAIAERRNAFNEDEAGDYLRCAGADGLEDSLGRMESDGPDAADPMAGLRTAIDRLSTFGLLDDDEPTVCYFCDRTTDRQVVCNADFDTEYVCDRCADVTTSPVVEPPTAADDPAAEIPPDPAAGSPFTFGDLSEAARIVSFHADRFHLPGAERTRLKRIAERLGDASEADPNP